MTNIIMHQSKNFQNLNLFSTFVVSKSLELMMDDGKKKDGVESVSVLKLFIDSQPISIHTSDTADNSNDI